MTDKMTNCECIDCKKEIESLEKRYTQSMLKIGGEVTEIENTLKNCVSDIKVMAARLESLEGSQK